MTWLVASLAFYLALGSWIGALVLLALCPFAAYAALIVMERASHATTQSYVVWALLVHPGLRRWIVEERRALRDLVYALGETLDREPGRSET